ncbi:hypothetical protein HY386_01530 [Candidatus Daviesbacteria bacterium]|nr:hypothetical protein [Candidatus Daviesbacteria bacterium]
MKTLSLQLPGGQTITSPQTKFSDLGSFISGLYEIVFYLAIFLAFFWLVWGAFQYIVAGGNKENLAKASARITWAIVGLLLVAVAFLIAQFVGQVLQPKISTPII